MSILRAKMICSNLFREGKQYFIETFRSQIGSEQDLRNKLKRILQIWAEFVAVHQDVAMLFDQYAGKIERLRCDGTTSR